MNYTREIDASWAASYMWRRLPCNTLQSAELGCAIVNRSSVHLSLCTVCVHFNHLLSDGERFASWPFIRLQDRICSRSVWASITVMSVVYDYRSGTWSNTTERSLALEISCLTMSLWTSSPSGIHWPPNRSSMSSLSSGTSQNSVAQNSVTIHGAVEHRL